MLLFFTFPDGKPGVGLFLLRAAVGVTAILQGRGYLAGRGTPTLWMWAMALLAMMSGALLLIGLLTKTASLLAMLESAGIALSWLPAPPFGLFDSKPSTIFVSIMAAAIMLVGPGAFSLDARLFGRREIIIPHATRSPKS